MRPLVSRLLFAGRRFASAECGTVAVAFGGSLLTVMLVTGAALDYGRSTSYRTVMESAVDAASIAAARYAAAGVTDPDELSRLSRRAFDVNAASLADNGITVTAFEVSPQPGNREVRVSATAAVPTTFMSLANVSTIPVAVSATARTGKTIEVAMMLDLTLSMNERTSDGRNRKIEVLEQAAKDLVATLMPDRPGLGNKVRIALAPYATGVDVGGFARAVTGNRNRHCVFDRSGAEATTDAPPSIARYPAGNGCPGRSIVPLTDDRAALLDSLDDLPVSGSTAGALGTAWTFNLLSPRWSEVFTGDAAPLPAGTPDLQKFAILMTDGDYNILGGSWTSSTAVNARAVDLCRAMQAQGITVYAVGFELTKQSARDVLRDCASTVNGSKAFYDAKDGDALLDAYRSIAEEIMRLHLSA